MPGGKLVLVRVEMAHDVGAAKSAIIVAAAGMLAAAACVFMNQKASGYPDGVRGCIVLPVESCTILYCCAG